MRPSYTIILLVIGESMVGSQDLIQCVTARCNNPQNVVVRAPKCHQIYMGDSKKLIPIMQHPCIGTHNPISITHIMLKLN